MLIAGEDSGTDVTTEDSVLVAGENTALVVGKDPEVVAGDDSTLVDWEDSVLGETRVDSGALVFGCDCVSTEELVTSDE